MRTWNPLPPGRDDTVAAMRSDHALPMPALRYIPFALLAVAAMGCGGSPGMGGADPVPAPTSASIRPAPSAPVLIDAYEPKESSASSASGRKPSATATGRPAVDLTQFVPNDALAYVEFRSMDDLEEALLRFSAIAELAGQSHWTPIDGMLPLTSAGIDASRVDRTAPIGIALAPVPGEFVPALVLIVPAGTDGPIVHSTTALKARRMNAVRAEGGYVVLQHEQMRGNEFRGNAAVTENLPEGFVRGRVSVAAIRPLVAPFVRDFADGLNEQYRLARPRVSDSQLKKLNAEALLDQLEVAEQIAFGIDLVQDQIDIELRLVKSQSIGERRGQGRLGVSVDPSVLEELSCHIELDDSFSTVFAFDRETMLEELRMGWSEVQARDIVTCADGDDSGLGDMVGNGLVDHTVESIGASIARMLGSFEPAAAIAVSMEPAKAHIAIYLATKDATRAREAISLLLSKADLHTWGFEMALPIRSMVDGVMVEDYSVRFDTRRIGFDRRAAMRAGFKTFLGDSALHIKVAASNDHVILLLGGDTVAVSRRIRAFDNNITAEPTIAKAVSRANRGDAATVVHTDFVQLISQIAGLGAVASGRSVSYSNREIVREVGTDSAQFTFWSSVDGDDELIGATFDLGELARAFEAFKGSGL